MNEHRTCGRWLVGAVAGLFLILLPAQPGVLGQRTVGVQCSCDLAKGNTIGHPPGFDCQGYCTASSGGSGYSGGSVQQQMLGTIFNSFMQGFMQGGQDMGQRQQYEQQLYERQLEEQRRALQEELDRQEAVRRQQETFRQEQLKTHGLLKGPKSTEFFGLKGVGDPQQPPANELTIKESVPHRDTRKVDKHRDRLHCAAYLADLAQQARKKGDEEEAAYLTEQSGQVMAGGKVGVKCPEAPARPEQAVEKMKALSPQDKFFQMLMKATKDDLDRLAAVQEHIKDLKARQEEATRKMEEKRRDVAWLQQAPPSGESRLAEALSVLRVSEAEERDATQALNKAVADQKSVVESIQQKQTLFQEVQADPKAADKAMVRLKGRGQ